MFLFYLQTIIHICPTAVSRCQFVMPPSVYLWHSGCVLKIIYLSVSVTVQALLPVLHPQPTLRNNPTVCIACSKSKQCISIRVDRFREVGVVLTHTHFTALFRK